MNAPAPFLAPVPAAADPRIVDAFARRRAFGRVRLAHLVKIVRHRWPAGMPADVEPQVIDVVIDHAKIGGLDLQARIDLMRRLWRAPSEVIAAKCEGTSFSWWRSADLGDLLDLDPETRDRLKAWTIRPAGWSDQDMQERARLREAERGRARRARARAAKTARPSLAAIAESYGVSIPTIVRWRRSGWVEGEPAPQRRARSDQKCVRCNMYSITSDGEMITNAAPSTPAPGDVLAVSMRNALARVRAFGLAAKPALDRYDNAVNRLVHSLVITGQAGAHTAPAADRRPRQGAG